MDLLSINSTSLEYLNQYKESSNYNLINSVVNQGSHTIEFIKLLNEKKYTVIPWNIVIIILMHYLNVFCSIWCGGACVIKYINGIINYITTQEELKKPISTIEPSSTPVETDTTNAPINYTITTKIYI